MLEPRKSQSAQTAANVHTGGIAPPKKSEGAIGSSRSRLFASSEFSVR